MPKRGLKNTIRQQSGDHCAISGQLLPEDFSLYDTHRPLPKRKGGTYSVIKTKIVDPIAHMKEHGTYRIREDEFDKLKTAMDDRQQIMKFKLKVENQIRAYERRTDNPNPATVGFLEEQLAQVNAKLKLIDKEVVKSLKNLEHPIVVAANGVKGVGDITMAACLVYIDLEKADHASSLWKYAGLHCASHDRYTKGEASGGNKTLRTTLYNMATSQMKSRGSYRIIYDQVKDRLSVSDKTVKTRNTQGQLIECAWKDTKPCHRNGAALRAVMKHFLADYWFVGRTLAGLSTDPVYAEAVLGKGHRTIDPRFRGWVF